jgi:hypothetical protein
MFNLTFVFDAFPSDISWALIEGQKGSGAILSGGSHYSDSLRGKVLQVPPVCLDTGSCYTFVIRDSQGDGLCCIAGRGSYTYQVDDSITETGGDFFDRKVHLFCVE